MSDKQNALGGQPRAAGEMHDGQSVISAGHFIPPASTCQELQRLADERMALLRVLRSLEGRLSPLQRPAARRETPARWRIVFRRYVRATNLWVDLQTPFVETIGRQR